MNKSVSKELLGFRQEIDDIDDKIIKLLDRRIDIVNQVGKHKKSNGEKFLIRSNREADMIKSLVKRSNNNIPKSVIVNIWRKIITCANFLEQDLKIVLHNPHKIPDYVYLIREYYGDFIPINIHDSVTNVISEIQKGEAQIAIFALTNKAEDNWWVNLANNDKLKIYAKIPFIRYKDDNLIHQSDLFAVAIKKAEKSAEDKTLLTIELNSDIRKDQLADLLNKINCEYKILKSANLEQIENITFYLIELDGFFENDDEIINQLSTSQIKPFVKIIGHYPTPIEL